MAEHRTHPPQAHQAVLERFVAACQEDDRVVAATLYGSHARGEADAYSDLDLGVITTDEAYADFAAGRDAFVRRLGEPLLVEDFGSPVALFVILAEGVEVEMSLGRVGHFAHDHGGPYRVLVDKANVLAGVEFPRRHPAPAEQTEALRRLVMWFWHDLSHFIAGLGRGQLWWAYGQLEELRRMCVDLAHLQHDFEAEAAGYDKVDETLPPAQLAPLQASCCAQEWEAMLEAGWAAVRFYREVAPTLARTHGVAYPKRLEKLMVARLEAVGRSRHESAQSA